MEEVFTKIYTAYSKSVYNYLCRLAQDEKTAEDLTQETFIRAWRGLRRFRGDGSVQSWLLTIARNVYLSHVRKAKSSLLEDAERVADRRNDILARERRIDIEAVLARLPLDYREYLLLRDWYGLSYAEVAQVTQSTPDQVRMGLHRARRRFRDLFNQGKGLSRDGT